MSDSVTIRRLVADDALKLKACFQRCYGDSYVADYFYDPERLRERITSGRLRSIVAATGNNDIVGHMGVTRCQRTGSAPPVGSVRSLMCYRGSDRRRMDGRRRDSRVPHL